MATENDRAVLDCIINPLLPSDEFNNDLSSTAESDSKQTNENTEDGETMRSKSLELDAVKLAEQGKFTDALEKLNEAIALSSTWASAYNNRAQVFRLLNQNENAMKDLNSALQLTSGLGKVASQAYCQRAMLHQLSGNSQEAIKDWESASNLGSKFAKQQLVQFNPYAALCNKMLHDVFKSLKGGS